jgi:hypothetical protein
MSEAFQTYVKNAEEMAGRAIESREKIYQGKREAELRAAQLGLSPIIEVQTWMSHEQCKALVADNQWNIRQSIMYSQLALARAAAGQLAEAKRQTMLLEKLVGLLEGQVHVTDAIHDSLKEMKVY